MAARLRIKYKFQLDAMKGEEAYLVQEIDRLKSSRLFVSYIRNGLLLMLSLIKGDTSVLRRLFPEIVRQIEEDYHAGELERLNKRLDELNAYIQERGMALPAPKMMSEPEIERIPIPGDKPKIVLQKAAGGSAGANFLAQMKQFAQKGAGK